MCIRDRDTRASAQDRGKEQLRVCREQQDHRVRRWFFQRLEERFLGGLLHRLHIVNDHHPPGRFQRSQPNVPCDVPYRRDIQCGVPGPAFVVRGLVGQVELQHVRMDTSCHSSTGGTHSAPGSSLDRIWTDQGRRKRCCNQGLADRRWPRHDVRVTGSDSDSTPQSIYRRLIAPYSPHWLSCCLCHTTHSCRPAAHWPASPLYLWSFDVFTVRERFEELFPLGAADRRICLQAMNEARELISEQHGILWVLDVQLDGRVEEHDCAIHIELELTLLQIALHFLDRLFSVLSRIS